MLPFIVVLLKSSSNLETRQIRPTGSTHTLQSKESVANQKKRRPSDL